MTCPGIFPLILTLLWSRQTQRAAILSPILGLACGIGIWLGLSKRWYGTVSIVTTTEQAPSLYGSLASLFSPLLFSVILSYVYPEEQFDWRNFLRIDLIEDPSSTGSETSSPPSQSQTGFEQTFEEKQAASVRDTLDFASSSKPVADAAGSRTPLEEVVHPFDEPTLQKMRKWLRLASVFLVVNILVTFVAWPMPL